MSNKSELKASFFTKQGEPYEITYQQSARLDRFYCVALHKSGSVLFDTLVKGLCAISQRSCVDVEVQLFRKGLNFSHAGDDLIEFCRTAGVVYSGFRELWRLPEIPEFRSSLKLMLVRDPRDIAISYYHSQAKSHAIPTTGPLREALLQRREVVLSQGPSEFILSGGADVVFSNMNAFAEIYQDPTAGPLRLYKYEDIIYEKLKWTRELATALEIDISEDRLEALVARHDVFPEQENPQAHIRRVHPGGYRGALTPEAIAHVEDKCAFGMGNLDTHAPTEHQSHESFASFELCFFYGVRAACG